MKYALWTVQVLLAALFLFAGVMKFLMPVAEMTKQVAMPGSFLHFIGVCEILGALGLIFPVALNIRTSLTPLAAGGLVIIMIGATVLCLKTGGVSTAILPLVTGLLATFVVYGRLRFAQRNNFPPRVDLQAPGSIQD